MKIFKKILVLLLILALNTGLIMSAGVEANAAEKAAKPKIEVSLSKSDMKVKIKISKTAKANTYLVICRGIGTYYEDYMWNDVTETWYDNTYRFAEPRESILAVVSEDGTKDRTVELNAWTPGDFEIYVLAYSSKYRASVAVDVSHETTYTIHGREYYSVGIYKNKNTELSYDQAVSAATKSNVCKLTIPDVSKPGYRNKYDLSSLEQGDTFLFGSYEQDGDLSDGNEPIEWVVLSKTKSEVLVMSKYALDIVSYHNKTDCYNLTWEKCTLRKWLNSIFIKRALNKTEQKMIKTTALENYDTKGGRDTKDKVFLLSMFQLTNTDYGFWKMDKNVCFDEARRCAATAYAGNISTPDFGTYLYGLLTADYEKPCSYYTRTPGYAINDTGEITDAYVMNLIRPEGFNAVRPAMWIKFK